MPLRGTRISNFQLLQQIGGLATIWNEVAISFCRTPHTQEIEFKQKTSMVKLPFGNKINNCSV
jgi:hypothetical protein